MKKCFLHLQQALFLLKGRLSTSTYILCYLRQKEVKIYFLLFEHLCFICVVLLKTDKKAINF